MQFHERLYEARKRSGMTQNDLAERLDVSRQAVSRWEMGTAKPDFENLIAISDLFEISIDYLLKGREAGQNDKTESLPETEQEEDPNSSSIAEKIWLAAIIIFVVLAVLFTLINGDWNSGIFTALVTTIVLMGVIGLISLIAYLVELILKRIK